MWLINYKHFLSWKTLPDSVLPDLSTVQFSVAKATFYFKVGTSVGSCVAHGESVSTPGG